MNIRLPNSLFLLLVLREAKAQVNEELDIFCDELRDEYGKAV